MSTQRRACSAQMARPLTNRSGVAVATVCTSLFIGAVALAWSSWGRRPSGQRSTGEYDPSTGIGRGAPGFCASCSV